MKRRWLALLIFAALILTAVSCRTPAGRMPGEVFDDSAITTKVKAKLFDEGFLRGLAISVQTFQGEVTLIGAVDNEEQKSKAGSLARSVDGVKRVNNLLEIKKR